MNTHFAVCDAHLPFTNEDLKRCGSVNLKQVLIKVAQEGYFPTKNLDVLNDRLIFHLDNGNNLVIYLITIH